MNKTRQTHTGKGKEGFFIISLTKPKKLCAGDTIATISLSSGAAGNPALLPWYCTAKKRLGDIFNLNVVETTHCLKGSDYIYHNPQARADDLMEALSNPAIKAIFLCQGGDDACRVLPHIDMDIVHDNPKIFLGFSDATIIHHVFLKQNIVSFYGPNVLTTLSEPVQLHDYTIEGIKAALFHEEPIGVLSPSPMRVYAPIDWENGLNTHRPLVDNSGYEVLQGSGIVRGRLLGGCLGPIVFMLKGTDYYPSPQTWKGSILFLDMIYPGNNIITMIHMLKGIAVSGVFKLVKGIIVSSPNEPDAGQKMKDAVLSVLQEENLTNLPVLYNVDFGHAAPMATLPIGVECEIDCNNSKFSILESGVS